MTPGARVAAAIEILDLHLGGLAAEKALTNWARGHRFAGSKDRAAIRDLVFLALRRRRSAGAYDISADGRAWIAACLSQTGSALGDLFNGVGHAPAALSDAENAVLTGLPQDQIDLQDWVLDQLSQDLGADQAKEIARILQDRAPTTIRINSQKANIDQVKAALAGENIETRVNPLCNSALSILTNPRRAVQSDAFADGWFELQDAASQAIAANVPISGRVLDFCAGGGGKALALAARTGAAIFAHDVDAKRMGDIPVRAARAGHDITVLAPDELADAGQFDTIICDLPCSGSGAWRRAPETKWTLSADHLDEFTQLQREILSQAMGHLAPNGTLTLMTCSIFNAENQNQRDWLLHTYPEFSVQNEVQFLPSADGDGLYAVTLGQ